MTAGDGLQFDKVEATAGVSACVSCKRPISTSYYQVNGAIVCSACRAKIAAAWNAGTPAGRFLGALGLGVVAAMLGTAIYFGFTAITGFELSLIAIVVGYLVGRAVRKGSRGRGGPAYQTLAIFLTYSAIVFSYGFLVVKEIAKNRDTPLATADSAVTADSATAVAHAATRDTVRQVTGAQAAKAMLVLIGLLYALPFLGGASNIIGLVIIGIGVYEAWRLNRRGTLAITGPYQVGGGSPAQPA
jgi:hypothetical protein